MQTYGYSERGALNTLLYEIAYSPGPEALLSQLLGLARFPMRQQEPISIANASILIEQSLSDFGDADAIMLLDTGDRSTVVFLEAKVKPYQTSRWLIEEEYQKFIDGMAATVSSSNLFVQLYHKVRFVAALREGGLDLLRRGIAFPPSSTRSTRRIGGNAVVLRAVNLIVPYLANVRYLAIVPDMPGRTGTFFDSTLANSSPSGYDGWDIREYGYVCWSEIEEFCRIQGLVNTCRVLGFNKGQIY